MKIKLSEEQIARIVSTQVNESEDYSVDKERSDVNYELSKKTPKAKDGKWIQKAVNPKHKGYCTPMTKATCTPKRKALAMTFKKMAKARKGK